MVRSMSFHLLRCIARFRRPVAQPDTQAPIAPDAAAPAMDPGTSSSSTPNLVASGSAAAETGAPTVESTPVVVPPPVVVAPPVAGLAPAPVVVQPPRVIAPPLPSAAPFVNPGPSSAPPMEVRTDVEEQQEEETDAKCDQLICLSIVT